MVKILFTLGWVQWDILISYFSHLSSFISSMDYSNSTTKLSQENPMSQNLKLGNFMKFVDIINSTSSKENQDSKYSISSIF